MKILYLHTRELQIQTKAGRRKDRKKLELQLGGALPPLDEKPVQSPDALLVLVCAERGDGRVDLQAVRDDVQRARKLLGVPEIVIGAFGHLSSDAADAMTAREVVDRLVDGVRADHAQTRTFPFGWDKTLEIKLPAHHYNAAFRSFEPAMDAESIAPINGNVWDRIAVDYDQYMLETGHYAATWRLLHQLREHLWGGRILELGCGAGRAANYLAWQIQNWGSYTGVDSSAEMLRLARLNNGVVRIAYGETERGPPTIEWVRADMQEGNLAQRGCNGCGVIFRYPFDTVLMVNSIAYAATRRVLMNAWHLMRDGGRLVVAQEEPFVSGFADTCPPAIRRALKTVRQPGPEEIRREAKGAGFRLLEEKQSPIDRRHGLVGMVFQGGRYEADI